MKAIARFATVGLCSLSFISCSAVHSLADKTTAFLLPPKVPIVKARPKDMKELPLGKDQALAFASGQESRRGGGFWGFFRGPVDFKEPMLPHNTGTMDGSLLPPRAN